MFMNRIVQWLASLVGWPSSLPEVVWRDEWSRFLESHVAFYRALTVADRRQFHQRVILFLQTTRVEAGQFEVTDEDRLLVAASAIIPVWAFPHWRYFNLAAVFLLPQAFNADLEFGRPDSCITGMVGTGVMAGKLVLSKPDLYQGFANSRDKQNVAIHEFVHLIDMADGECDGYPERLKAHAFSLPWFELVRLKVAAILAGDSNIRAYATTNRAEFFAVASEYFFERPKMLARKHPKLYQALSELYQQDMAAITLETQPFRNAPCACGSGKKAKRCCMKNA